MTIRLFLIHVIIIAYLPLEKKNDNFCKNVNLFANWVSLMKCKAIGGLLMKNIMICSAVGRMTSYRITEIREESVPLAAKVQHNTYYGDTIIAMLCIAVLLVALAYILLCMFYQRRIRLLTETGKVSWNLWKLKKQVTDLEDRKAAETIMGIQKSAEAYSI